MALDSGPSSALSPTRTPPPGLETVLGRTFEMVITRVSSLADDEGAEAVFRVDGCTETPAVEGRLRGLLGAS